MPTRYILPFLLVLVSPLASAQALDEIRPKHIAAAPVPEARGGCDHGRNEINLDYSNVNALLFNNGALFWKGQDSIYEMPRSSGRQAIFTAGLWLGAEVNGENRFAGSDYGPYEFWPGPLDANGETTNDTCQSFDRFWMVRFEEILNLNPNVPPPDLASWPIAWGAPFYVDANANARRDENEPVTELDIGDPGYGTRRIDLIAGERPHIVGDEGIWWVMNDAGNSHDWSGTAPLGVEVRVLAYAFSYPGIAELNSSTFYRYTLINRSGEPITDFRASFFADYGIGRWDDDYLASDAERGMLIGYNGDDFDEGPTGYGANPPAIGIDLLSGAEGVIALREDLVPEEQPRNLTLAQNAQQNLWPDGTPIQRGDDGHMSSGAVTSWIYDGDPTTYAYWTEERTTQGDEFNPPGDRAAVINAPPVTLMPGESWRLDVALLGSLYSGLSSGRGGRATRVQRLRDVSDAVQAAYDVGGIEQIGESVIFYTPLPQEPPPPMLTSPADETDFEAAGRPDEIMFEWAPVAGADMYLLEFSADPKMHLNNIEVELRSWESSLVVPRSALPVNLPPPTYWRVVPMNTRGRGQSSDVRSFRYYVYQPGVIILENEVAAFVETASPSGIDPCGPSAGSIAGCEEVGGNNVNASFNSDGTYLVGALGGEGSESVLPEFAPHDFEIRFTAEGSYAIYPFGDQPQEVTAIKVPFEIWDVGNEPPFSEPDPSDDVQLIPVLFAEGTGTCAFDYGEGELYGRSATDQIFAYYPVDANADGDMDNDDYAAYEAEVRLLVPTDEACAMGQDVLDGPYSFIDFDRGHPLQRQVFVDNFVSEDVSTLQGAVIKFYTTAPLPIASEPPVVSGIGLEAAYPNPSRGALTIPYTLRHSGVVRLSIIDALGREVAVLLEGDRVAGAHEARVDASALAAGVYTIRLETDDAQQSRRIVLLR